MKTPFVQKLVPKGSKCPKETGQVPAFDLEGPLNFSGATFSLEDLVAAITPENRHEEVDWGPPMGSELI